MRWAQAATGRVPAALFGGKSLQSILRGVTCPLESQPMPQVASIWERPVNAEIARFGPSLLPLNSTAVYHTAPLPFGTEAIPASAVKRTTNTAMITIPRPCSLPALRPNVSRATTSSPGKMMCRMSPPPMNW